MPDPTPPVAERRPTTLSHFGDDRIDDYYWLRDRDDPAVIDYLTEENAYADLRLAPTGVLRETVYSEIVARIEETDVTAPVRSGDWWYYSRTFEGSSYAQHCRRPRVASAYPTDLDDGAEQVILDVNVLARGHTFCSLGILDVDPRHSLVAYGVDFDGDERYTLRFASLDGAPAPGEEVGNVGYAVAWTIDSRSILYVRMDEAWRPFQLWRHELFTDPTTDVLLVEEPDERFGVSVGRSRDDASIIVHVGSSTTTEVLATDARSEEPLRVVWPRRQGVECGLDHVTAADGSRWWLAVTNDGAADFRVLAAARDAETVSFNEVISERPGTRIDGVDVFEGHLAISERLDGAAVVRLTALGGGADPFDGDLLERSLLVASDEVPATTELDANPEYATTSVRVRQTSLVTPTTWFDVDLVDGTRAERKQTTVHRYEASGFTSSLLWVTARDGVEVPVSICHRRDLLAPDDAPGAAPASPAPLLLYGYGAYENSTDPRFSAARVSLLDRGVIYAIAHVRGGGELGRAWYEGGRLAHKETTFLDFVDVANALVDRGFTTHASLAALGGSAGGLTVGAAINQDPGAFRAVVAEVPFVDVLTTMLDPSLPLTAGEWEEWGDPIRDPEAYRRIKSWSPYDNVPALDDAGGPVRYPDLLVLGSLNDTRVSYWEPAKWVAKIRATSPSTDVVLKTEMGAGHAGPSGRYDAWRETAMIYAFVLDRLTAQGGSVATTD